MKPGTTKASVIRRFRKGSAVAAISEYLHVPLTEVEAILREELQRCEDKLEAMRQELIRKSGFAG